MKSCPCGNPIVGTSRRTRCNPCTYRAKLERGELPSLRTINVPTAPLRSFIWAKYRRTPSGLWGKNHNYERYSWRSHVSLNTADAIACSLGVHPVEIWDDWFTFGEVSA